ncbi:cation-translocating P-type ATPase [Brevibacterium sp. p3-SID960]|uniref:cation-translocating P-type ATPase n=1 Tax=Brevibacterium sp. p3-SID960 TaxID=2916063 RepID=UPI0021A9720A|nr:cation-translocating P-type ATPase [Brevibacterium sp. p3-SID960]MCT1691416.1 cation-translocating P-type ATPase [Brevibacterium sp. p3-SID960]
MSSSLLDDCALSDAHARTAADVVSALDTSATAGLTQAAAAERLERCGRNELAAAPSEPIWRRVLRLLNEPLTYLLLAAILVSLIAWAAEGRHGAPIDAIVIAAVVVLNTVIGLVQELKAADAVAALKQMTSPTAAVTRSGRPQTVPAADLVPGDLLHLSEGDAVPADARLLTGSRLMVAEAALTGESVPVHKHTEPVSADTPLADRLSMVHAGTAVTQGGGTAVITGTGARSEIGRIAGMISSAGETDTPLQKEMAAVGKMLTIAVIVIALAVMATVYLTTADHSTASLVTILLLGVSLAVAAVPEGLTAIVSVILAIGVRRMASHEAIVKQLDAVESLGSAGVVCTDKTGTLTLNQMTIDQVITADGRHHISDPQAAGTLELGSIASNARLTADGPIGDPTEAAFLLACADAGIAVPQTLRFDELPFSSERKRMSVLVAGDTGDSRQLVMKGAPDVVLDRCTHVRTAEGDVEATPEVLEGLDEEVTALAGEAYRTLAVAAREVPAASGAGENPEVSLGEEMEHGLTFVGMVAMIDPPRPEAKAAISQAQQAGIRVIMITGDHPLTAERIAADLGIDDPKALTGAQLSELTDAQFAEAVETTSVFARVDPSHKLRIVEHLQDHGHVVAMTGDGVNDAPALKRADIGVAMGITGTQVSHDAATMILADDNFASIITAVKQGRGIYSNLKKVLRYLLSSNMGEVFTVFCGVVFASVLGLVQADGAVILPLLATQILWVNLVTDSTPALALGVDPVDERVMTQPPRRPDQRALDGREWARILSTGFVMAVLSLLALDACLPGGLIAGADDAATGRTVAFTVLVVLQLVNTLSVRHAHTTMFAGLLTNHWLWLALAAGLLLQLLVVYLPILNTAFSTVPLDGQHWLLVIGCAVVFIIVEELRRAVVRIVGRG